LVMYRQRADLGLAVIQRIQEPEIPVPAQSHHVRNPLTDQVLGDDLRALPPAHGRSSGVGTMSLLPGFAYYAIPLRNTRRYGSLWEASRGEERQHMTGLLAGATGVLVDGRWRADGPEAGVRDKFTQQPFAVIRQARPGDVEDAVTGAAAAAA